jgi:predicted N-formylglutamate amidohydrolase
MPERSEVIDVPGNAGLSEAARADRATRFYWPFHAALSATVQRVAAPVLVTVHSFTPIYHGKQRSVEIGILHDSDARLADAMLDTALDNVSYNVQRNAPYGASDGVTHTLLEHAIGDGHLNVMLEIRNDLIETSAQQQEMAAAISRWIADACARLKVTGAVQCQA